MPVDTRRLLHRPRAQAGFTILELAIVIVLFGLVIVPLLWLAASSVGATRAQQTQAALETARDALIAFAAANNGCLPFAADFEGGIPDTDLDGVGGYFDTGDRPSSKNNAGDLPWADLGLGNSVLDGDDLRVQYYVATPYTDKDTDAAQIECSAAFRGLEWNPSVTYQGSTLSKIYVFYGTGANRNLYEIEGTLPAGTPPDQVVATIANPIGVALINPLLEVRRGPDPFGSGSETDVIGSQNVFVLIAPGENRNADLNRSYVRDSTHRAAGDTLWPISSSTTLAVNSVVFSAATNVDATDANDNGDDTLLVMSFIQFKSRLKPYGLVIEPICEVSC